MQTRVFFPSKMHQHCWCILLGKNIVDASNVVAFVDSTNAILRVYKFGPGWKNWKFGRDFGADFYIWELKWKDWHFEICEISQLEGRIDILKAASHEGFVKWTSLSSSIGKASFSSSIWVRMLLKGCATQYSPLPPFLLTPFSLPLTPFPLVTLKWPFYNIQVLH